MEKYCENSITKTCKTNKEVIKKIYEHSLINRKPAKVSLRPKTEHPYIDMVASPGANLKDFYPDFEAGDYAYIKSCLDGLFENDMIINIRNCEKPELYFNGEGKELEKSVNDTLDALVTFKAGKNDLLLKITATEDNFGAMIVPLIPKLRMGPGCYVYSSWQYIEKEGFRLQSGIEISRLYKKNEKEPAHSEIEWVFPVMPPQSNKKQFDFNELLKKGKAAYSYTHVCGKITITHKAPVKIFEGDMAIYCENEGTFAAEYEKSTPLLIKSAKSGENWGFTAETEGEHSLPFIDGADTPDLQWLWIGGFGRENDSVNYPYPPEKNLHFDEPYPTVNGEVYWRFYRKDTYLKQHMHSIFYGQWFYPLMVGLYGLKQTAEKLGYEDFYDYFQGSIKTICEHRGYGNYDTKLFGWASYMAIGCKLDRLDPIGTIGINVSEYYMMTADRKAQYILKLLADALTYDVPRFSDGTFNREKTMWTDDLYMCLPFLVRLGVMTGDERYFDDILTQVRGFYKRLYMENEGIFSHIFFIEEGKANKVPWGRGNGWVLLALSEVLLLMPGDYHGYNEILEAYRKFAKGILKYRDKEKGFWHQVINNPESYMEASGSAMFITALARGVRLGWIDKDAKEEVVAAWEAMKECCIDEQGNVYGVCKGSGCNMEEKYYLDLETIINDEHGVGIVLGAGVEVMNMLGE